MRSKQHKEHVHVQASVVRSQRVCDPHQQVTFRLRPVKETVKSVCFNGVRFTVVTPCSPEVVVFHAVYGRGTTKPFGCVRSFACLAVTTVVTSQVDVV